MDAQHVRAMMQMGVDPFDNRFEGDEDLAAERAYPFSNKDLLIVLDQQNVAPVRSLREDAKIIRRAVENQFQGIKTDLRIYADLDPNDRRDHYLTDAVLYDIPKRNADESKAEYKILVNADRKIMTDVFRWADDHPPPAVVFLISGDGDYYRTMEAMVKFGYTTIVAYGSEENASGSVLSIVDYEFDYSGIITRGNFSCGPSQPGELKLKPVVHIPHYYQQESRRSLILFDLDTIQIPKYMSQEKLPEINLRADGVEYIQTDSWKENLMENLMIRDIGSFMVTTLAPSNIIIYSAKESLASTISSARSAGFWVTVCSPHDNLRGACNNWYPTPGHWNQQQSRHQHQSRHGLKLLLDPSAI